MGKAQTVTNNQETTYGPDSFYNKCEQLKPFTDSHLTNVLTLLNQHELMRYQANFYNELSGWMTNFQCLGVNPQYLKLEKVDLKFLISLYLLFKYIFEHNLQFEDMPFSTMDEVRRYLEDAFNRMVLMKLTP